MYRLEIKLEGAEDPWQFWDTLKDEPTDEYCKEELKNTQKVNAGYNELRVVKIESLIIKNYK